jgi:hypothetical protein
MDAKRSPPPRSPAWRFHAAAQLQFNGRSLSLGGDRHVKELASYLIARSKATSATELARLQRRFPNVAGAYDLHTGSDYQRELLHCRILSQERPQSIARRLGVEASVVMRYETLFFDVRPRIQCVDWITEAVLSPVSSDPAEHLRCSRLMVAYLCGGPAIELLFENGNIDAPLPWESIDHRIRRTVQSTRLQLVLATLVAAGRASSSSGATELAALLEKLSQISWPQQSARCPMEYQLRQDAQAMSSLWARGGS